MNTVIELLSGHGQRVGRAATNAVRNKWMREEVERFAL